MTGSANNLRKRDEILVFHFKRSAIDCKTDFLS